MNEIERKFLVTLDSNLILEKVGFAFNPNGVVDYDPDWGSFLTTKTITQHYLKDTGDWAIRVRKYEDHFSIDPDPVYLQTMKHRISDRKSIELEQAIEPNVFDMLSESRQLTTPALIKNRYEIVYKGRLWELDVFQNPEYAGLILAEIELTGENESFPIPFWVGKEVTDDKKYRNARLARKLER